MPLLTRQAEADFLVAAEAMLRGAGGISASDSELGKARQQRLAATDPGQPARSHAAGGGFFQQVNSAALANIEPWIKQLFPTAYWQPNNATPPGAWRVRSADLGRSLEEDISVHPELGGRDFGLEEPVTPINLVMAHGDAPDATSAAHRLCDWLGIPPERLGWLRPAGSVGDAVETNAQRDRPRIHYEPGKIHDVVDQAEQALITAGLGLYQRGGVIVRPGRVQVSPGESQDAAMLQILEVRERTLVEEMTKAADWVKFDSRSNSYISINAPLEVAQTYLQRKGHWKLPVLTGIINAPTLRADGSILSQPGYDSRSGLLLDPCGVIFPEVPEEPSHGEGREAISLLMRAIESFPFVADTDRAVALSTILTAVIRRSLPTAPLHAFTAPVMGSGKSTLVDIACVIANGRSATVVAQGNKEEELEKRLGALLLAGESTVPIDNCETPLGGVFLCQLLTQTTVRARILGRSEAPELPTNAMVTATGNNLMLSGDVTRRAVLCRLDPQCERPELRRFPQEPVAVIRANRPQYVVAALTALRAYHIAGRPKQRDPLGSFRDWSRWVRDALIWLELEDPVATMEQVRAHDPALDAITAVLTQWAEALGERRVTCRDIIDCAAKPDFLSPGEHGRPNYERPDFREALLVVAGEGGAINSRRLGKWIALHENRIIGGLKIARQSVRCGSTTWSLQKIDAQQQLAA